MAGRHRRGYAGAPDWPVPARHQSTAICGRDFFGTSVGPGLVPTTSCIATFPPPSWGPGFFCINPAGPVYARPILSDSSIVCKILMEDGQERTPRGSLPKNGWRTSRFGLRYVCKPAAISSCTASTEIVSSGFSGQDRTMPKNRCSIVTGSLPGLEYAIANSLGKAGRTVAIRSAVQRPVVARRNKQPPQPTTMPCSVSPVSSAFRRSSGSPTPRRNVPAASISSVTRPWPALSPIDNFSIEDWNHSLAMNVPAAFHYARLALPGMRKNGWGHMINLPSLPGDRYEFRMDNITAKTARLGMTRDRNRKQRRPALPATPVPGVGQPLPIVDWNSGIAGSDGISRPAAEGRYPATQPPADRFAVPRYRPRLSGILMQSRAGHLRGDPAGRRRPAGALTQWKKTKRRLTRMLVARQIAAYSCIQYLAASDGEFAPPCSCRRYFFVRMDGIGLPMIWNPGGKSR